MTATTATTSERKPARLNYPLRYGRHIARLWKRSRNPIWKLLVMAWVFFTWAPVLGYWMLAVACMVPVILLVLLFAMLRHVRPAIGFGILFGGD